MNEHENAINILEFSTGGKSKNSNTPLEIPDIDESTVSETKDNDIYIDGATI